MADELSQRERALRWLPPPYSLVLRLRDAGISADALYGLYRMAEAKLLAAQNATDMATTGASEAAERTTLRSRGSEVSAPLICPIADDSALLRLGGE